jgi:hypothetical protein
MAEAHDPLSAIEQVAMRGAPGRLPSPRRRSSEGRELVRHRAAG